MTLPRRPSLLAATALLSLMLAALVSAPALASHGRTHVKLLRYGPFTVPAGDFHDEHGHVHEAHLTRRLTGVRKPCDDCWVRVLVPLLRYADGSPANYNTDVMLHHAVWSNSARQDLTCPSRKERFFASGNERTPIALPWAYGYRVRPGDSWNVAVELMNMKDQPQTVYVDLIVGFRHGPGVTPVTPTWLDIDNCGDSRYSIPAGISDTHRDWTAPWNGKVVAIGGHVHDDGRHVKLTNETTRRSICKSVAGYGTKPEYEGHIESMTRCQADPVGSFRTGDRLRLHSVYDSTEPQDDVMGIMLGYAVPTG